MRLNKVQKSNILQQILKLFRLQLFRMRLLLIGIFSAISTLAMTQSSVVNEAFLQSFVDAFNAHDINAIMNSMTDDCVFQASAGPTVDGETFQGQAEVRKAFENVFKNFPDARWSNPRHLIIGDRGISEWTFSGTKSDGTRVEVTGCDLFTFSNGKIAIKNSYRKNRIP